jgi:hypothetical protein
MNRGDMDPNNQDQPQPQPNQVFEPTIELPIQPSPESPIPTQQNMPGENIQFSPEPEITPAPEPSVQVQLPQYEAQPSQPAPVQPTMQPQVANVPPSIQPPVAGSKRKKGLIIGLIAALIMMVIGSVYVFAIYIPNQPENVWNTGMTRSGDVIQQLVDESTTEERIKKFEKSEVLANLEYKEGLSSVNVGLTTKNDNNQTETKLKAKANIDGQEIALTSEILTDLNEGKSFPDIYFKIAGIQDAGLDLFLPEIGKYENEWIYVSSEYLEQLLPVELPTDGAEEGSLDFAAQDVVNAGKIFVDTANEYIFTAEPDKAVIENRGFTGKEDDELGATYRYVAGINQENAKKFCNALVDNMLASESVRKIAGNPDESKIKEYADSAKSDCSQESEADNDETFDIWIDAKSKIIRKIRVYSDDAKKQYVEIGQKFEGGDEIPFYLITSENGENYTATITLNTKTGSIKGELSGADLSANIELSPLEEDLNITPPTDVTNVETLFEQYELPEVLGTVTDQPRLFW